LALPIAVFTQRNLVKSQLRKHSASIAVHACFHPCQALAGPSQDLLAMLGVRFPIPVPGTRWGRRAMSFASILLPVGSRIPVPGT